MTIQLCNKDLKTYPVEQQYPTVDLINIIINIKTNFKLNSIFLPSLYILFFFWFYGIGRYGCLKCCKYSLYITIIQCIIVDLYVPTRKFVTIITFCLLFDIKSLIISYQALNNDAILRSFKANH